MRLNPPRGKNVTALGSPRSRQRPSQGGAFARIEGLVALVLILIVLLALLPFANRAKSKSKQFQLFNAAASGDLGKVKSLVGQGVSINCTNEMHFGFTPLIGAIFHYQTNVICYLVETGASVDAPDRYGQTPLMHLMGWGDDAAPMVKLLIEHGAKLDTKDDHGTTVFGYAHSDPPKPKLIEMLEAARKQQTTSTTP